MFPKIAGLTAVLLQIVFGASQSNELGPRAFSEGYIEGLYGRFFEFTDKGASSPCPRVIDHFSRGNRSAFGDSWTVPHEKIVENGNICNDGRVLALNSFNSTSKMPDQLMSNPIAIETFHHMKKDSTGFWMGTDQRTCGKWVFPKPSFVFFVREFDRDIRTSFRIRLEAGQKYMFVIAPKFTCIYLDIPRRSPTPNVVLMPGDGTSPTEGASNTESTSASGSSDDAQAEDPTETEWPSETTEDAGDMDIEDDSDLSIIDIQNGATPPPAQTPRPGTIQDILNKEDEPATAIVTEDGDREDFNETGDSFDNAEDYLDEAGDSLCFPGSATVELRNGRIIRMDQLSVGDEVRIGEGYSHVFGFTHKDPYARQSFIRLTTRNGKSITLTSGHYLYANNRLIPAKEVRPGDSLRVLTGAEIVETVETVIRSGLFNPQTLDAKIVVNGVVTSCYTTAVSMLSAHAILTPLRVVWRVSRLQMLSFLETGSLNSKLARWWGALIGPGAVEQKNTAHVQLYTDR